MTIAQKDHQELSSFKHILALQTFVENIHFFGATAFDNFQLESATSFFKTYKNKIASYPMNLNACLCTIMKNCLTLQYSTGWSIRFNW